MHRTRSSKPHGHEQRNGCQHRLTQREDDPDEDFKISGSVNSCRFDQAFRNRSDIRPDNDHIECADHRRDHIYPERIQQVQVLHQKISRNQAGVKVHRQNKDQCNRLAEYIFPTAQRIRQHRGQDQIQQR